MADIHEILNATNYMDYVNRIPIQNGIIDTLFPTQKIDSFELNYIVGASEIPIAASVHAQDTNTQLAERESLEVVSHTLAEVRRQIKLSQRDAEILETPRHDAELNRKIQELYNDAFRMVQAVDTRFVAMAWEAFTTGKITFNENGFVGEVDYKVPNNHKINVVANDRWDKLTTGAYSADILTQLQNWSDLIQSTENVRPNRAITSQRVINIVLQNTKIRSGLYGVNAERLMTLVELNSFLSAMGLPTLHAFDGVYRKPKTKGAGYDIKRFMAEDSVVLYVDGAQGKRIFGRTDEELIFARANDHSGAYSGNYFVDTYSIPDPAAMFTRAAGKGLPTFPSANRVIIATNVISL